MSCFLKGKRIYLRKLQETDVNDEYLRWMNDYEVVKYTESRFFPHTFESLNKYLSSIDNYHNIAFAIIDTAENKHIGNIKLGNINYIHGFADIGIIIGNKDFWGKGIATEAIDLLVEYSFKRLNLRRLIAGAYMENSGSIKAFEKVGFKKAYIENEKYLFEGRYMDAVTLELTNKDSIKGN